jgi:hypothetical protein
MAQAPIASVSAIHAHHVKAHPKLALVRYTLERDLAFGFELTLIKRNACTITEL